ncbi:uncharacterized protein LOC108050688 [Drosophila rhopaloa]|uniref:Uncharacterized protein LOC108050688 n=1 Tax=Drosophila rhopaloa TaxID=1041015 RepID=A0A6P4FBY4_DRORH|nr:uncharacterized protein LOC108050688 [Drosophila rhopaloa]
MLSVRRVRAKTSVKKRTTGRKVPKMDPQQQRYLKTRFKTTRPNSKSSVPPNQRIWRRTVVQTKPKQKSKIPKIFRMDRVTGLPVDYERTVQRVMHYVNPHLNNPPSEEEVLEELLTKMFAQLIRRGYESRDQVTRLRSFFKDNCKCQRISHLLSRSEQNMREANENLCNFHSACKRGPRQILNPNLGPTYMSRFNFNQLRIKST